VNQEAQPTPVSSVPTPSLLIHNYRYMCLRCSVNQEAPPTPVSSVPTQQAPSLIQNYAQVAGAVSYQHHANAAAPANGTSLTHCLSGLARFYQSGLNRFKLVRQERVFLSVSVAVIFCVNF